MSSDLTISPELVVRAKRQIRARMRALRSAIPRPALDARSAAVVARILELPSWSAARSVALYAPLLDRGEVDIRALDGHARSAGRRVYYPCIDSTGRPGFRLGEPDTLEERGAGYPEPPVTAQEARPGDIDLVVVPALAVDETGLRIGYGSGFYDAALGRFIPPAASVVVAYHFQLLAEVPATEHDVRCDWVVTDERVVRPSIGLPTPRQS